MAEIAQKPEIFAADERSKAIFEKAFSRSGLRPGKHGWSSLKTWTDLPKDTQRPILVAWMLEGMTQEAVKRLREHQGVADRYTTFLLFQGSLPMRAIADRIAWLNVRNEERVFFVATNGEKDEALAARVLLALDDTDGENRIVDAWWEGTTLVVVSPTPEGFRKLRVPLEKLPVLQRLPQEQHQEFEIDEEGAFLYWPGGDIHLGWEQFEYAVDKAASLKAQQQTEAFNKAYGAAIRKLRREKGLRQSDMEGLTARQVGRIESGRRATLSALRKLAASHGMSVNEYMDELAKCLSTRTRQQHRVTEQST
jgi:hypothetical protein